MSYDLSIIIPTLNRISLPVAVYSALNQISVRTQVIVVGDHVDPSPLLNDLKSEYSGRLEVIVNKSEKSGAPVARNIGAQAVRSGFISFLDDDDQLLSEFSKRVLPEAGGASVIAASSVVIKANRAITRRSQPHRRLNLADVGWGNSLGPSGVLSQKLFHEIGGWDESLSACQDWDLWLRAVLHGGSAIRLGDYLHLSNQHSGPRISNSDAFIRGTKQFVAKHRHVLSLPQIIKQELKILRARVPSSS